MKFEDSKILMSLALDVDYLRKRLIPGYDLCKKGESWASWEKDLRSVARLHRTKLRVAHKLSSDEISGVFSDTRSQISVASSYKNKLELDAWDILTVFTHEMGHALQEFLLFNVPEDHKNMFFTEFKYNLAYEQTAETLGYYVARNYFKSLARDNGLRKRDFKTYFKKGDILFLAERYGRTIEDPDVQKELRKNGFVV